MQLIEFARIVWLYRRHGIRYAVRIAHGCVYRGLPF